MNIRAKFRYPTQEEIEAIHDKAPGISRFGFLVCFPHEFEDSTVFYRYDNLYSWDMLLKNRIVDFNTCYMYVLIHLKRGVPKTSKELVDSEPNLINYLNANFYLNYLFVCFETVNDTILQIINLHFKCGLEINKVSKRAIKKEMKHYSSIVSIIENYYLEIKNMVELRNSFAHRFSTLEIDNRARLEEEGKKVIMPFCNDLPNYDNMIKTIEDGISDQKKYIEALKLNIIINPLNTEVKLI